MRESLAAVVKRAMRQEGASALARRVGVTRQALYKIAEGRWPRSSTLDKLEAAGFRLTATRAA